MATLLQIKRGELLPTQTSCPAEISDVQHLASYNWIENPFPNIVVPGAPALWRGMSRPTTLEKDTGTYYIAENAARHPQHPMEPLFRSLFVEHPIFDLNSIDLVTDRNNLRKLLAFVDPTTNRNSLEAFTIAIEVVHDTVVFCRQETATTEDIEPWKFRGYGHAYEEAATKPSIPGATGHFRVISYNFDGIRLLLRHQTDAYVEDSTKRAPITDPKETDLSEALNSISLGSKTSHSAVKASPSKAQLQVEEKGLKVLIGQTLELKTRVHHKPLSIHDVAAQLWISQTPQLVRAYHNRGRFEVATPENVAAQITSWERQNQTTLQKLVLIIQKVTDAVKHSGSARLRYDSVKDALVVQKVDARPMLPADLYAKWKVKDPVDDSDTSLSNPQVEDEDRKRVHDESEGSARSSNDRSSCAGYEPGDS